MSGAAQRLDPSRAAAVNMMVKWEKRGMVI
jgi:hypothetical protein